MLLAGYRAASTEVLLRNLAKSNPFTGTTTTPAWIGRLGGGWLCQQTAARGRFRTCLRAMHILPALRMFPVPVQQYLPYSTQNAGSFWVAFGVYPNNLLAVQEKVPHYYREQHL